MRCSFTVDIVEHDVTFTRHGGTFMAGAFVLRRLPRAGR